MVVGRAAYLFHVCFDFSLPLLQRLKFFMLVYFFQEAFVAPGEIFDVTSYHLHEFFNRFKRAFVLEVVQFVLRLALVAHQNLLLAVAIKANCRDGL